MDVGAFAGSNEGGTYEESRGVGVRVVGRRHGVAGEMALPVLRRGDGTRDRSCYGPDGRHADGEGKLRRVGRLLAAAGTGGEPRCSPHERCAQIRRLHDPEGAARVEQLDAHRRERRGGDRQAQAAAGQGHRDLWQRHPRPVAAAKEPPRRAPSWSILLSWAAGGASSRREVIGRSWSLWTPRRSAPVSSTSPTGRRTVKTTRSSGRNLALRPA